jgi:hypothetical protein
LEKQCCESLPYLLLTRGASPSYRTLCTARTEYKDEVDTCWISLFAIAKNSGFKRVGRIDVDSTKIRADVSPESVIKSEDFAKFRQILLDIIEEAEQQDKKEDEEGYSGQTILDKSVSTDQMREIIRKVRKSCKESTETKDLKGEDKVKPSDFNLGPRMFNRVKSAVAALDTAMEVNAKHISLTDPDARMMGEGRTKRIEECHAFEVAVDAGVLVAAQTSQSPSDNDRLLGLVEKAEEYEPDGIREVVADSGYFSGNQVRALEDRGILTCIPDPWTSCDIRKGLSIGETKSRCISKIQMEYDDQSDCYNCPAGNALRFSKLEKKGDETFRIYQAERSCKECELRSQCLQNNKAVRRMLRVGDRHYELDKLLDRFNSEEHKQRYHDRGKNVETIFAFCRSVLRFDRWLLRGAKKVAAEGALFATAYQIRKIHKAMVGI